VIPLAALVGGFLVTLLTGPLGILDATRVAMVGGTLLAAFSFIPAITVQPLLDASKAAEESTEETTDASTDETIVESVS
jgi:hypothetical protein